MEYTVQRLARLAGASSRALRYYDEIGLLKPVRINSSGYRIYGQAEVDKLQQILFYRELGMNLEAIQGVVNDPSFDRIEALKQHRDALLAERARLDVLISNVKKTLTAAERGITMNDKEKFAGFKRRMVEENETKYGQEIRRKYGDETVNQSNQKVLKMTSEQYEEVTRLETAMKTALLEGFETGNPGGEAAQRAVEFHKQWLMQFWPKYTEESHAGLGNLYVEDQRFRKNYDSIRPGMAEFFRDAIHIYTGRKN